MFDVFSYSITADWKIPNSQTYFKTEYFQLAPNLKSLYQDLI